MKFDELIHKDILPFDAQIVVNEQPIGIINGTFDRNGLIAGFFAQVSHYDDSDPRQAVCIISLVEKMLVSWDLEENPGEIAKFSRLWDMPMSLASQIVCGVFSAATGQAPSCMRKLID